MSSTINLGLERIRDLLAHLPTYTRPTCHVAGTNGKGSVTALLSSVLKASSYRVGRFNSPHLVSVLDSITICDFPVSQAKYDEIRRQVEQADKDHATGASSFELLTATALMIFEDAKVDIAVVEVGMGGRLDATNVIPDECILVSALTSVDLDHQAFLGNTIEEIAAEKAAIARKGRPFVLGPQNHPEVENVVRKVVAEAGGTFLKTTAPQKREWDTSIDGDKPVLGSFTPAGFTDVPQPVSCFMAAFPSGPINLLLPLRGHHQKDNLATALTMVTLIYIQPHMLLVPPNLPTNIKERITVETVISGVRNTRWAGRLSFHTMSLPLPLPAANQTPEASSPPNTAKYLVLADGAHNQASSTTLAFFLIDLLLQRRNSSDLSGRKITLSYVLALSHSPPKTPHQTLTPLFQALNVIVSASPPPAGDLRVRVALVKFTPPEGMPWVSAEPPSELRDVVASLIPKAETWIDDGDDISEGLPKALNWAISDPQTERDEERLIIVAGSLYLVADFYRLLQAQQSTNSI